MPARCSEGPDGECVFAGFQVESLKHGRCRDVARIVFVIPSSSPVRWSPFVRSYSSCLITSTSYVVEVIIRIQIAPKRERCERRIKG